jgi:hypothetical protein
VRELAPPKTPREIHAKATLRVRHHHRRLLRWTCPPYALPVLNATKVRKKKGSEPFPVRNPEEYSPQRRNRLEIVLVDDFPTLDRHNVAVNFLIYVFRNEPNGAVTHQELGTTFVIATAFGQPIVGVQATQVG